MGCGRGWRVERRFLGCSKIPEVANYNVISTVLKNGLKKG
jgi:hypothetical protein